MKQYLKYLFSALSIGLTLISMHSGFYFYLTMFDQTTAILATFVFEILRLATLYSLVMWEVQKRLVSGVLYAVVACVCAFAATSSFHARIIESHQEDLLPYKQEIESRITLIRKAYAEKMAEKVSAVEEEIDQAKKKVAGRPNSTFWPKRVQQLKSDRQRLIAERDSILSAEPNEELETWLNHHAAIVGVELEPLPARESGSAAISQAIQELWVGKELTVKKIVAILITLGIEIGIILLAVFARVFAKQDHPLPSAAKNGAIKNTKNSGMSSRKKKRTKQKEPQKSNFTKSLVGLDGGRNNESLMEVLQTEFDETTIKRFIAKVRPYYQENGKLPSSRTLDKNMIPVRNAINSRFSKEDRDQLLG